MADWDDERKNTDSNQLKASVAEDRGKHPSSVGPSHSLRTHRMTVEEPSSTQSPPRERTQTRTISISIDQQPPLEVRPGNRLPPIVVHITHLRHQEGESSMGEEGSLWAQVSLMSADGQMTMALFASDILGAEDIVKPLFRELSATSEEEKWSLAFIDLRIRHSGNFKIHIAVLRSSQSDQGGDEDPAIEPPRELMGVDTQVIRVHAFAPSVPETV